MGEPLVTFEIWGNFRIWEIQWDGRGGPNRGVQLSAAFKKLSKSPLDALLRNGTDVEDHVFYTVSFVSWFILLSGRLGWCNVLLLVHVSGWALFIIWCPNSRYRLVKPVVNSAYNWDSQLLDAEIHDLCILRIEHRGRSLSMYGHTHHILNPEWQLKDAQQKPMKARVCVCGWSVLPTFSGIRNTFQWRRTSSLSLKLSWIFNH